MCTLCLEERMQFMYHHNDVSNITHQSIGDMKLSVSTRQPTVKLTSTNQSSTVVPRGLLSKCHISVTLSLICIPIAYFCCSVRRSGPTRGGCSWCAVPDPIRVKRAHEYQSSKLKRTIMHELIIVALNGDGNMTPWHT